MIEARSVWKSYRMGQVELSVLKGVSLSISPGDFVAVTGPSGAGKSTLLHLLAGLDTPTKGDVLWDGESIARLSDARRSQFRSRKVGVVFQFYYLMPELSALENVLLPGLIARQAKSRLRERAEALLKQVGLQGRLRHKPQQLSGGEQQRVAIARALMNEPAVLFADEPTGNLDSRTGEGIIELLTGLPQLRNTGLVLVTHDEQLAARADHVIALHDGRILDAGSEKSKAGH